MRERSSIGSYAVAMNKKPRGERAKILRCLVEGNSIRPTVRITGAAKNTVIKLLVDAAFTMQSVGLRRASEASYRNSDQANNNNDDKENRRPGSLSRFATSRLRY
jgi:hypothetical protein